MKDTDRDTETERQTYRERQTPTDSHTQDRQVETDEWADEP